MINIRSIRSGGGLLLKAAIRSFMLASLMSFVGAAAKPEPDHESSKPTMLVETKIVDLDISDNPDQWQSVLLPKVVIVDLDVSAAADKVTALAIAAGADKKGFKRIEVVTDNPEIHRQRISMKLRNLPLDEVIHNMCLQAGVVWIRVGGIIQIRLPVPNPVEAMILPKEFIGKLGLDHAKPVTRLAMFQALRARGVKLNPTDIIISNNTTVLYGDKVEINYVNALAQVIGRGYDVVPRKGGSKTLPASKSSMRSTSPANSNTNTAEDSERERNLGHRTDSRKHRNPFHISPKA